MEAELEQTWREWDPGVRLVTLRSQYHSVARPILRFINAFERREHDYDHIIVLIPVIQPDKWYQRIFHNQLDLVLSTALRDRPELAVTRLPVTMRQLRARPAPTAAPAPRTAPTPSAPPAVTDTTVTTVTTDTPSAAPPPSPPQHGEHDPPPAPSST